MPPRKKPRRSSPNLEATAWRSSRPGHGVGGHVAQLQKVEETVAAPARKGPKGDNLQISSSEENPMAPLQLQEGKKNPPTKHHSTVKKTQNKCRTTGSSQHPQAPTSCLNPHVAHSSERFGFKEPQSNGHKRAREGQPMQKDAQSSGHKMVGQNMGQQDVGHKRESTEPDSGCKKDRQHTDDDREFALSSHECDGSNDNAYCNDDFDSGMQMDRDDAQGDVDSHDEPTDMEQDEVYDVLEHHRAKNRQCKASSPTHLLNGQEHAHTFHHSKSSHQCPSHSTPEDTHQSENSKQKVKTHQDNPSKLGFYLPTWQAFLQIVKLEMQLQAILAYPIPESQEALNLAREVLDKMLWTYHKEKIKLERGYFPQYNMQMGQLLCNELCNDLFTFCTELKKIIISIAKRGSTMQKDEAQKQVTTAATKLLKSGDYLQLPDSSDLKGVISGFCETSTDKVPDLTAEQCRTHFVNLQKSVDTLLDIPECCEELEDMLEQWARVGIDNHYSLCEPYEAIVILCDRIVKWGLPCVPPSLLHQQFIEFLFVP
ncbi:hypothetical protein BDR06DRAFT_968272 [Suillus hirtellus]|nr:hypothetical protein BDR06DRAFT_968272 [Suillus hirtellus]